MRDAAGRADVEGVTPDPDETWAALLGLLQDHPAAQLNAVDEQGLFVPLPAPLRALGRTERIARSGIELVETADHGLLIDAWLQLLETGRASAVVRDKDDPSRRRQLHFLDLRARHGVLAAVAWTDGVHWVQPSSGSEPAPDRPRLGRVRKDRLGRFVEVDRDAEAMLGHGAGGLDGASSRDLVHPDDQAPAVSSWLDLLTVPGSHQRSRLRLACADGSWLWVDVVNHNRLDDPAYGCVVSDLVDVSAEMALRQDAQARERLLQRLAQALPVGLLQAAPSGEVLYTNDRVHELLGVPRRSSLAGQLAQLSGEDLPRALLAFAAAASSSADHDLQVEVLVPGGRRICTLSLHPLADDTGSGQAVLGCFTDITEGVTLRAELEQQATYDALTGCLNRASVLRRLDDQVRGSRAGRGCAVLFFDLDGFKGVNDTLGHAAGDALLREVADALHAAVRVQDAVGRLGGDEFVVACPGVRSAEDATALAEQVRAGLSTVRTVGASVGVAWTDEPTTPAGTLLAEADAAMYAAKRNRRAGAPVTLRASA